MANCQSQESAAQIVTPLNTDSIIIKCQTWTKTYSNLYDYCGAPTEYSSKSVVIDQPCSFVPVGDGFMPIRVQQDLMAVMRLKRVKGAYLIEPGQNQEKLSANQVWLAVTTLPSRAYQLKEGDIVRIGKQKLKIKQITLQDNQVEKNPEMNTKFKVYEHMSKQNSEGYNPSTKGEQPICRVCMEEAQLHVNPLIAPCKCSGSAKFIHIKCIQEWFNKAINPRRVNASLIITWRALVCELCSQPLPYKIYFDGVKHFLVDIPRPDKPYIVINPLVRQKNNAKTYHLVSFKHKTELSLGRKKQADVVLDEDATISRSHSSIKYLPESKKFLLSDRDSKFGTLVLIRKPFVFSKYLSGIGLQINGSVCIFSTNKHSLGSVQQAEEQINREQHEGSQKQASDNDAMPQPQKK